MCRVIGKYDKEKEKISTIVGARNVSTRTDIPEMKIEVISYMSVGTAGTSIRESKQ